MRNVLCASVIFLFIFSLIAIVYTPPTTVDDTEAKLIYGGDGGCKKWALNECTGEGSCVSTVCLLPLTCGEIHNMQAVSATYCGTLSCGAVYTLRECGAIDP